MQTPRRIGRVHGRGLWAHYHRGMARFFRFGLEALVGPVASSLLFLLVFSIAIADTQQMAAGVTFVQFLAPGIAMFTLINSAFDTASFPIVYDKLDGMVQDLMMSPLAPWEMAAGYALAGATSGLITGGLTMAIAWLVLPLPMAAPLALLGHAVVAALLFGLVGTAVGLWADKWDQLSVVNTFMLLPLAFLSGAFFSLDNIPVLGRQLMAFNPVFYAIDGARYGVLGTHQAPLALGAAVVLALLAAAAAVVWRLFSIGYKIKP